MSHFGPGFLGTADGPPVGGNDANTLILLHFDGANGSTTFVDSAAGLSGTSWSAVSPSAQSTAASKFGAASLYSYRTTTTPSGISTTSNPGALVPTSGNFTVDAWINSIGHTLPQALIFNGGSSFSFSILSNVLSATVLYINGTQQALTINSGATTLPNIGWQHVAFVKNGGSLLLFLNGVQVGSGSIGFTLGYGTSNATIIGGAYSSIGTYDFYIDEVRYSNVARYTSAGFTPNSGPYS